jgi:signal transduction histidine kinase
MYTRTQQTLAIRRDYKGDVWSSGLGENRLWRVSNGVLDAIQYPHDDLTNDSKVAASIAVDKQNKLWIATFGSHVYRSDGGRWENMDKPLGREPGILGAMEADQAGNVWFAFSNHVVEWDGIALRKYIYGGTNRYPTCLNVRREHVWLGAEDGIQLFIRGEFHMLKWKDQSLPGRITGIVETETGDLWTNGFSGVAHVSGEEIQRWLKDPNYAVAAESFNTLDGLPGLPADRYPEPSIIQGDGGRLWFSTIKGVAWLDPASVHNVYGSTPPRVFVSSVLKDGSLQSNLKDLAFAPGTENIEIDYTALGMAIPQRVLFRYRLDGVDKDWQDAGTRRQAFYTKLRPGRYQFSVIACNYFGVWNNTGAVLTFRVVPAWYQTIWFRCLVGIFVLASMWAIVVARSRQAAAKVELRMADRLMERDRIARELHDTLLQGVQALILRFQLVADSLPNTEPLHDITQKTLLHADQLLAEGRDRVKDLRTHDENADDLAVSFEKLREELRDDFARDFRLVIEGKPHKLHRVVRDEIELIAREALSNAFRHAGATDILCAINCADSHFVLVCEDDGIGIDTLFLSDAGKTNHWGLLGMRERAQRIGATLRVQRAATRGTVIELKVPARTAYREM